MKPSGEALRDAIDTLHRTSGRELDDQEFVDTVWALVVDVVSALAEHEDRIKSLETFRKVGF